ncbi:MAG: ABC transporter substrate-binding protein [bacterium]|nr:ABC transporter substrate-binding protein [bacterium]
MISSAPVFRHALVLLFALVLSLPAIALGQSERRLSIGQETSPDVIIATATEEIVAIIKAHRGIESSAAERERVAGIIQAKLAPLFDFTAMTRLAVGASWRHATPEEQRRLVEEFRALLLHTYSRVLLLYQDHTIVFKPLRMTAGATDAMVRFELQQSGRDAISITLAMEKMPEGWKVYDVTVGGMSLVTTYRDSFKTKIRESGIDGLIRELEEKNRQLRGRP